MKIASVFFFAIQSCMALVLTPHEASFPLGDENVEVAIDVNATGDAILMIGELAEIKIAAKNGTTWGVPEVIANVSFPFTSPLAKIDDEGNMAAYWEMRGSLWGTKREKDFWCSPQCILSPRLSPYEVNSKGDVLFFEKMPISYPDWEAKVCLVKKNLGSIEISKQPLGPTGDHWSGKIQGAIAKNRFGDHLFVWKSSYGQPYYFVRESEGVCQQFFDSCDSIWGAAYDSSRYFCLVGRGTAEDEYDDGYEDGVCSILVESADNYSSFSLFFEEEVEDMAIAVDANDEFLMLWETKKGISAFVPSFRNPVEPQVQIPSFFLKEVSIKNGNFKVQPEPQGGFILIWQQSFFNRENRQIEYALYACRYDPLERRWTEAERLTPEGTQVFLKGFATNSKGERLVVWVERDGYDAYLRTGTLD